MDILCLVMWIALLVITVVEACKNKPASYSISKELWGDKHER